jgi:hypothetical protein
MKKLIVILFVLTLLMAQCTDVNVTVVVQNDATTGDTSIVQDVGVQDTFRPKDIVVVETDDIELTEDVLIETEPDADWDVNNEDANIGIEEVSDVGVDTNAEPDYGVDYGVDEGNDDGGNDILDAGVDVSDVSDVADVHNYGPGYWDHRCCDERYGEVCQTKCFGDKADYENNGYFGIVEAVYDEQKDCWYYKQGEPCCEWICNDIWGLDCDAPCDIHYLCYYENKYYGEAKCERIKSIPDACKGKIECNGGDAVGSCYYVMISPNIWGFAIKDHYCGDGKKCYLDEEGYPICK